MENKLKSKYYGLIWAFAILSAFVLNVYSMYLTFSNLSGMDRATITINVLVEIVSSGVIPAAITYLAAVIVYIFGFRRYARAVSKNDFTYTVLFFMSIVKFVVGIIASFGLLSPIVYSIATDIIQPLLTFAALMIMFFVVFVKVYKFNPTEKYLCFKGWSTLYLVFYAIVVVLEFGLIFMYSSLGLDQLLIESGYAEYAGQLMLSTVDKWIAIVSVVICIAIVITVGCLNAKFRKDSGLYSNSNTHEEYMNTHNNQYDRKPDSSSIFGMDFDGNDNSEVKEDKNDDNDDHHDDGGNVFDEFGI